MKRTIKQVAELLHVSEHTLRFYEKERLILPERKANGYRVYDEAAILLLKYVIAMRHCGFTIPEIRSVIKYFYEGYTAEVVAKISRLLAEKQIWVAEKQSHYNGIAQVIDTAQQTLQQASDKDVEVTFDAMIDRIVEDVAHSDFDD